MFSHQPNVLKLYEARPVKGRAIAPVILDSPHSGTIYPEDFNTIAPLQILHKQEDSFVDQLYSMAPYSGAVLLCAEFPRSYIDPNRAEDDLDIRLIEGDWPAPLNPTEKTRLGHGLVWHSYLDKMPMYNRLLRVGEIKSRIDNYWRPYHQTLEEEMEKIYTQYGGVWHINCHSMPASSSPFISGAIGGKRADFVLGTLDGRSCDVGFSDLIRNHLEKLGYTVRLNYPYKGAELVRRYGNPHRDRHSIQIEINRALYLDERNLKITKHFRELQTNLGSLCDIVCDYALNQSIAAAAE